MRKGSSFNILTRDSHLVAFFDQGRAGKSLSSTPVNSFSGLKGMNPLLKDFLDESMELLVLWERRDLESNVLELIYIESSCLSLLFGVPGNGLPSGSLGPLVDLIVVVSEVLEGVFELGSQGVSFVVDLSLSELALLDQGVFVNLGNWVLVVD